jgi:hypothetical protein
MTHAAAHNYFSIAETKTRRNLRRLITRNRVISVRETRPPTFPNLKTLKLYNLITGIAVKPLHFPDVSGIIFYHEFQDI